MFFPFESKRKDSRIYEATFWRICLSWELIANSMTRGDGVWLLGSRFFEEWICDGRGGRWGGINLSGVMDGGFWNLCSYLWEIMRED